MTLSTACLFSCKKKGDDTPGGNYTKNTDSSYTTTLKNELGKRLVMKVYDRTEDYYAQKNPKFSKIFEASESLVFPDNLINDSSYLDLYAEDFSSTNWLQLERPIFFYKNQVVRIATMGNPRPRRVLAKMTDSVTNWVAFDSYIDTNKVSNWNSLTANQKNKQLKIRIGRLNYSFADNGGIVRDSSWDFLPYVGSNLSLNASFFSFQCSIIVFSSNYSPSRKKYDGSDDTAFVMIDSKYYLMYRQ